MPGLWNVFFFISFIVDPIISYHFRLLSKNVLFLFRAAQKLLSSKKKHKKTHSHKQDPSLYHPTPMLELTPSRHAQKEIQPYPFPTKFKEVLRVSSPAVPPGLLKLHTKRTDGKVRPVCKFKLETLGSQLLFFFLSIPLTRVFLTVG